MNNLTPQQKVIIINNFESDVPENAQKVCLISNKDKQRGKYSTKCTKIAITQQKIDKQINAIDNRCGDLSIYGVIKKKVYTDARKNARKKIK